MLSGGSAVIKYLIFLFNGIFVITGLALLIVGAVIKGVYRDYHHFLDDRYFSAPNLLIAVGVIVLLVSFFGCCGSVKENYCMLLVFTALLILIFILELAGGIAGYVMRDQATEVLTTSLKGTMPNYGKADSTEITAIWDTIQRQFSCCGATSPADWPAAKNGTSKDLPISCCPPPVGAWGNVTCSYMGDTPNNTTPANYYTVGCVENFGHFVREKAVVIGGAGIGVAMVELVGVVFACKLAIALRRSNNLTIIS